MSALLRSRWWSVSLFLLSLLVALDFFFGGAFSFPLLHRLLPGKPSRYAGTILLLTLLAVAHALNWIRAQDRPWSVVRGVLSSWWPQYPLVLIIIFAIWSRLGTLDWDIQHGPDGYEGHFIRAVKRMLIEGDLNHGYHEYPGLFIYLLLGAYLFAFVVAVGARMGTSLENIPAQHFLKMGRCLVAGFGVLNVVLTFPLGLKWFNRRVGLFAAALVAVSYLEIYTSHYVRPDIVLETFFVVALLQLLQLLERGTAKSALLAGAAVGAAIAVKYTGVLAIPALALAVGLGPADATSRWLRGILAGAALIVTYALASPYTFLDLPGFLHGVAEQGVYNTDPSLQPAENMARYYTEVLARESIGYFALLLMFVGAARVLAAPRRKDLVVVAFLASYFLFLFAAPVQFDRFLLPVQPVLAVLAGHGLEWFFERAASSRRNVAYLGAAALMGLALAPPLAKSIRYLNARTMPSVRDDVRAWALTHLPPQSRIGVSRLGPSFSGTPFIEGRFVRLDGASLALLVHFDFLVSAAIDDPGTLESFREVARFEPRNAGGGHTQVVYQVPAELRPRYERIPLETTQLSSTFNPGELANLLDGNPETRWQGGPSERAERIEIELGARRRVGKIVLTVPDEGIEAAAGLRVLASLDGRNYFNARRFILSEAIPGAGGWMRQSILLGEGDARILRLSEPRDPRGNLFLSEIEIYERVP